MLLKATVRRACGQLFRGSLPVPSVMAASVLPDRRPVHAASSKPLVLTYDAPGEPEDVLRLLEQPLPSQTPAAGQALIQMIKAPINPSDVNTVQGKYPLQPKLPGGVPGHEGVGRVLAVGDGVTSLKEGDLVVPLEPAQGTWRQMGMFKAADWHPLPANTPVEQAATLCINPPSALAMLEEYVELKPGEVVLQNGGTSAVAQLVSQIARSKGLKTVSVIRSRPDMEDTVARLKALGADLVTTEDKLRDDITPGTGMPPVFIAPGTGISLPAEAAKLGPPPRLGLNCVGGSSALALSKALAEGGTLVTYGGMSMQPVTVPTSLLIFKDLTFRGFWLSGRLSQKQGPAGRAHALDRLAQLAIEGQIQTQTQSFPISDYKAALQAANQGFKSSKVLLGMS